MSEQAKADWRDMEAGATLDRAVAERLGWHIEIRTEDGIDEWWVVLSESQYNYVGQSSDFGSEDEAWARVFHTYECVNDAMLPLYSRDANAALALPTLPGLRMEVIRGTSWLCSFIREAKRPDPDYAVASGTGDTPAMAIVECWLKWMETK